MIQAIPTAIISRGADKLAWADSLKGTFDLSSAYRIVMGMENNPLSSVRWIWKADTLPRIKTFLWLCAHNSIAVKVCLEKRGVVHETLCPICQGGLETILHALRDCTQIKQVWNQLGIMSTDQAFWRNNMQKWLASNGTKNCSLVVANPPLGKLFFPLLCGIFGRVEIGLCSAAKIGT